MNTLVKVTASPRVSAHRLGPTLRAPTAGMTRARRERIHLRDGDDEYRHYYASGVLGWSRRIPRIDVADHNPGTAETIDSNQMRDILISWIDAGMVAEAPAWNERDLLFVIFPPAEVTLVDRNGAGGFCGYHWYGHYRNSPLQKDNLFFAVIDTTGGTDTVAHELSEAFTDRSLNGWYSNDAPYSEIADVCSFCGAPTLNLGGFAVASYWLVGAARCLQQSDLTPAPPPAVLDVSIEPKQLALNTAYPSALIRLTVKVGHLSPQPM